MLCNVNFSKLLNNCRIIWLGRHPWRSNTLLKAGFASSIQDKWGCRGLHLMRFWISAWTEVAQLPWAPVPGCFPLTGIFFSFISKPIYFFFLMLPRKRWCLHFLNDPVSSRWKQQCSPHSVFLPLQAEDNKLSPAHSVSPNTLAIMVSVPLLEKLQFVTSPLNWEGVGLHICSGGTPWSSRLPISLAGLQPWPPACCLPPCFQGKW